MQCGSWKQMKDDRAILGNNQKVIYKIIVCLLLLVIIHPNIISATAKIHLLHSS